MLAAFLIALPQEVQGAVLEGPAPALDGPALDLAALLAFNLPLPKLVLGSFYPTGSRNIIR